MPSLLNQGVALQKITYRDQPILLCAAISPLIQSIKQHIDNNNSEKIIYIEIVFALSFFFLEV
jgi:hypothetical protein